MRHTIAAVLAMLAVGATSVDAQLARIPRGEPAAWGSLSVGLLNAQPLPDGSTGTVWDFGSTVQYRGTLEWALRGQAGIGVSVAYARLPMTYYTFAAPAEPVEGTRCDGCDAEADVWSITAMFHAGGGEGFHQVIELSLGVNRFTNFENDDTGETLAPAGGETDLTLGAGYGFGYGLGDRMQIMVVYDRFLNYHQGEGLEGGNDRLSDHSVVRLGIRYGLGSRLR